MISDRVPPGEISDYIIKTPYLKKEDKEQYLNKVRSEVEKETDEGMRSGYKDIRSIIVITRGDFAPVKVTGLEKERVRLAEQALDEWIERQRKDGKFLSVREIRSKASEIGASYKTTLTERMMRLFSESESIGEEFAEVQAIKEEYDKIPREDVGRIRQALINSGRFPDPRNIIQVYKENAAAR